MSVSRRQRCDRCARPLSHCLCAHVQVVAHRTAVLVLQHPQEAEHPFNTARLAVLGLANAQCWVGDCFDALPARLAQARRPVLLFPGADALTPQAWREDVQSKASAQRQAAVPEWHDMPDLLVVPDGTWRQAGRLVRCNPALAVLPRIALSDTAPSQYRIRRAARPDAVSTLEAIVLTLSALEPAVDFQPVLHVLDAMVEGQIRSMGEQVYARHVALSAARRQADDDR